MSANMVHPGIPTTYRGVRMRSRLEARWAAFFDALGWAWMYEPIELPGWIADFAVSFSSPLLVEVKPALTLDDLLAERHRIANSGWQHEVLLVGGALHHLDDAHPVVGLLAEREASPDGPLWLWDKARLFECLNCGATSVLHESGSWRCRACGADGGHVGALSCRERWDKAGNRVQWVPGNAIRNVPRNSVTGGALSHLEIENRSNFERNSVSPKGGFAR